MKRLSIGLVLWLGVSVFDRGSAQDVPPAVRAGGEELEGVWLGPKEAVFRGVPFAAAPVGELRWRAPEPHRARSGRQQATGFAPVCVQTERLTLFERSIASVFGTQDKVPSTPRTTSEDCLYLNVWTDNLNGSRPAPVMVWIHGGSNVSGEGSSPWYDGRVLARQGVVVVTINYRLGVFGFLAHPGLSAESPHKVSGNYGLLDQLAALRWVKANIKAFGGDPGVVTIFGESAGSIDILSLMASPASEGLFHRAIAQSGAPMGVAARLAQAEAQGIGLGQALGSDTAGGALAALRRKPAADLLPLADRLIVGGRLQAAPIVDGWVLPDPPGRAFANGKQRRVPLLIGTNAREMTTLRYYIPKVDGMKGYRAWLGMTAGQDAERLAALYPAETDAAVEGAMIDATTDVFFTCPAKFAARAQAAAGSPTYLYQFTRVLPGGESLGAYHAAEIGYVFGTKLAWLPREPVDDEITAAMGRYWVSFATTGKPEGQGLPSWPAYDGTTDRYLELGPVISEKVGLRKEACDVVQARLPALWGKD